MKAPTRLYCTILDRNPNTYLYGDGWVNMGEDEVATATESNLIDEIVRLRRENEALKAQAATRPEVHTFVFGEESWHLLHPMECDIRSCDLADDEELIERLLTDFGVRAIVARDTTTGEWKKVDNAIC